MSRVLLASCLVGGLVCASLGVAPQGHGGEVGLTAAQPVQGGIKGEVKEVDFNSQNCGGVRKISVYLPPDHDPKKSYPVMYGSDGMLNVKLDLIEPLIESGKIPPIIIVATMYGPGMRMKEYVPQVSPADFKAHEKWIVEEVLPWAEKEFGASKDRKERIIFGSSNGGPFALTLAARHPEVFGNVFAHMVYALDFAMWEQELKEQEKDPTRYILVAGTLDKHGAQSNQKVEQVLKEKKFPVTSYILEGEGHTNALNRKMLPIELEETFGFRLPDTSKTTKTSEDK